MWCSGTKLSGAVFTLFDMNSKMNVELWFYHQTLNPNTRMIIGLVSTVDPTKQINIALSLTDINVTINTSSMSTNNSANIFTLNAWNFLNVDITNGNSSCFILYNSLANQATLSSTGPFLYLVTEHLL